MGTSGNCQSDSCDCNSQKIGNRRRELRLQLRSYNERTSCTNSSFISRRDGRCNSNFFHHSFSSECGSRFTSNAASSSFVVGLHLVIRYACLQTLFWLTVPVNQGLGLR